MSFQPLSFESRFRLKVTVRGDCWDFSSLSNVDGYRVIWHPGYQRMVGAHRIAYEMAKGAIPSGHELDHLCRHRWCVRPSHLEVVLHKINVRRGDAGKHLLERAKQITHCPQGHAYDELNTYRHRGIHRGCRKCRRAQFLAFHERRSRGIS